MRWRRRRATSRPVHLARCTGRLVARRRRHLMVAVGRIWRRTQRRIPGRSYGARQFGAAYVSGAVSYSNYWMSTNRTVTVAGIDQLHADFNAQDYGARLEGG